MARLRNRKRTNGWKLFRGIRKRRPRRLRFEPLESRQLLTTLWVANVDDSGTGSLRDLVIQANLDDVADTIYIPYWLDGSILLTSGHIEITNPLTIRGYDAPVPIINAQQNSRIFDISAGSFDVTLEGLTLTGGKAPDTEDGGAIRSLTTGTLDVIDSTISGNSAATGKGGGIHAQRTIQITDSTISGNTADQGGGISANFNSVEIAGSTISENVATDQGGGVYAKYASVNLSSSTIAGNTADSGGGISTYFGSVDLTGSTTSGNTATNKGGGIYSSRGSVDLTNSTISENEADSGGGIHAKSLRSAVSTISRNTATTNGGGVFLSGYGYGARVVNSIIAGNTAPAAPDLNEPDGPSPSVQFSLIGDNSDSGLDALNPGTNLIGTSVTPLDPRLGPLAFQGGPTQTHGLLAGSPALDAGDPLFVANPPDDVDQRGTPFARVADGDGTGGPRIDMGAYELQMLPPEWFVVTTRTDELDYGNDVVSLREAIHSANGSLGADTITFDPTVFTGQSIYLSLGEFQVRDEVVIQGPGDDILTIHAQQNSQIFDVPAGNFDVTLSGVRLYGGQAPSGEDGGAIRFLSGGTLNVVNSTISGNVTDGSGGAIQASSGSVNVTGSTISDNQAYYGGGIHTRSGEVTIAGSVISGNSSQFGDGGGISTESGPVQVTGSTISDNSASPDFVGDGGGIYSGHGAVSITDSTISGNIAGGRGGGISTDYGEIAVTRSTISGNAITSAKVAAKKVPCTVAGVSIRMLAR